MGLFKSSVKSFIRLKRIAIPGALVFIVVCGLDSFMALTGGLSYLLSLMEESLFSVVVLAYFAFAAFEYIYDIKFTNFEEVISSEKSGKKRIYLSRISVLLSVVCVFGLFLSLVNIISVLLLEVGTVIYALHSVAVIFVNYTLISVLGVMIGVFAAYFLPRLPGYLFCVLSILLPTQVFRSFFENLDIYPVYDFFNIFAPDLNTTADGNTGLNVQGYRVCRILFFIFVLMIAVFFSLYKRQKIRRIAYSSTAAVLAVVCCCVSLMPWSKLDTDGQLRKEDYLFYAENTPITETADFVVEKYDINLKIRNQLYAEVEMELSETAKKEYIFTLYHGFEISSVEDENGNKLDFEQNGDYFSVDNVTDKITVKYSGWNYVYYSNEQGVFLSGSFPYYPRAGYLGLTPGENANTYVPVFSDTYSYFNVETDSFYDVYSNLEGVNSFSGEADCITLMGGYFITQYVVNGTRVVYPYTATLFCDEEIIEREIKKLQNHTLFASQPLKTVFVVNQNTKPIFAEHMEMAGLIGIDQAYEVNLILDDKYMLSEMIYLYKDVKSNFDLFVREGRTEKQNGTLDINVNNTDYLCMSMQEAMDKYGTSTALQMMKEYLYDNSDTRGIIEFFDDILE